MCTRLANSIRAYGSAGSAMGKNQKLNSLQTSGMHQQTRICLECSGGKKYCECPSRGACHNFGKQQWLKSDYEHLCVDCVPKVCAGPCKKAKNKNAYHKDQWSLIEGLAICNVCHRKRCWTCSKLKKQDEYPSRVIWNLPNASPELFCTLCTSGPRTVGFWTCVRCRVKKACSEFSIAVSRSKAKGQPQVPRGSCRCDVCVKAYEDELQEQSLRTHKEVQLPSGLGHTGHKELQHGHSTSQKEEPRVKKMYVYNCPTCQAVLQSAVYTGNIQVKHKTPPGKDCSRQFRVSCGQVCAENSYCFDHAKCPKHSTESYGVSRSNLPEIVECKKCGQRFRVPKDATRWRSTCPKGCLQQDAVQD